MKKLTYSYFSIEGMPHEFNCALCGTPVPPLQKHECENGKPLKAGQKRAGRKKGGQNHAPRP